MVFGKDELLKTPPDIALHFVSNSPKLQRIKRLFQERIDRDNDDEASKHTRKQRFEKVVSEKVYNLYGTKKRNQKRKLERPVKSQSKRQKH